MRLLNTSSWKLEEFTDSYVPKYAILSHRWETEEITCQDLQPPELIREKKKGWVKLNGCCTQAIRDGFQWVWIDTCCIDKSSSAELSEAINSMFNWYKEAQVCYAYLSDVSLGADEPALYEENSSFRSSKWFTRGWTLQELLAPEVLVFFDREWRMLGERDDLWKLVSVITGIKNWQGWWSSSIAQKMSWASRRETTRIEDTAYSLMGLFGVNMPPLYGEREKAFLRLQLEILKISDDESIFAWQDPEDSSGGLLAGSPKAFQRSGNFRRSIPVEFAPQYLSRLSPPHPYWMTNKGLRMERTLLSPRSYAVDSDDTFFLPLQCNYGILNHLCAILVKCTAHVGQDQFARISAGELFSVFGNAIQAESGRDSRIIYFRQREKRNGPIGFKSSPKWYKLSLPTELFLENGFAVTNQYASCTNRWQEIGGGRRTQRLSFYHYEAETAAMEFSRPAKEDSTPLNSVERIMVIFNAYDHRSRVAIYKPNNNLPLDQVIANLVGPGDWMTEKSHLFGPFKLKNGTEIGCKLLKDEEEWDYQGYVAEVHISYSDEELI